MAALIRGEAARFRTLRTEEALVPALPQKDSYVKRGDPVRLMDDHGG